LTREQVLIKFQICNLDFDFDAGIISNGLDDEMDSPVGSSGYKTQWADCLAGSNGFVGATILPQP